MLAGKPWEEDDGDVLSRVLRPEAVVPAVSDPTLPVLVGTVPEPAVPSTLTPDTLAHKAERLTDADLDAAIASCRAGDFAAAELRLARVPPPCILHPPGLRPKVHLPGYRYSRRGAGLQAKKVSPWNR